jgi:hypothetical protein
MPVSSLSIESKPDNAPAISFAGPLFVVGVWRSGTSLLYALLNQHPQIGLMYEGDLPLFWPLFMFPGRNWPVRWEFWNSSLQRHQMSDAAPRFRRSCGIAEAAEAAYREYAGRNNATIGGEKSPTYHSHLPRLARLFPNARFLVIWRDPADICRSIAHAAENSAWFRKKGIMTRALFGCESLRNGCDELRRRGANVHELTYEQLIQRPEAVMADISRFLGIDYDPRMATLKGADRSAIYGGVHHELVKGDRILSSAHRPEILSPALVLKIERYSRLWKERYGKRWPSNGTAPGSSGHPGLAERVRDRLAYQCLRWFDAMVMVLYVFAPLGILRAYRDRRKTSDTHYPTTAAGLPGQQRS